ncbi:hypothetical protein EDD11_006277 [Mortierella claussenii]|nr:hypothetical protein EDD11_006277 [Mortierella claussenii]
MNPTRSSYVEYGTGNMLNLDVGTIKRKIDSNEYDDEIIQQVQPNGKRTCSPMNQPHQFAAFGTTLSQTFSAVSPLTPNGHSHQNGSVPSNGSQASPSPYLRTAVHSNATHTTMQCYHTPESAQSSVTASPLESSMDMDMEASVAGQDSQSMVQNTNAVLNTAVSFSASNHHSSQLLPSALSGQNQTGQSNGNHCDNEYVPVHGRSMEIPSYARVPLSEVRKYRDQRWSSCIYGADTRIGQGMMI